MPVKPRENVDEKWGRLWSNRPEWRISAIFRLTMVTPTEPEQLEVGG
jgi:hypothetical protein